MSNVEIQKLFVSLFSKVYFRDNRKAKFVEAMIKGQNITDRHISIMVTMIKKKQPL